MIKYSDILLLDEPTTGLDVCRALQITKILSRISSMGGTTISIFHQPNSEIFSYFNKILLMAAGKCVFYGEQELAVLWLERLGFKCPEHFNRAEFLLQSVSRVGFTQVEYIKQISRYVHT